MTNNKMNECRESNIKFPRQSENISFSIGDYKISLSVSGKTKDTDVFRIYQDIIKFNECNLKTGLIDYINKKDVCIYYYENELRNISCDILYKDFTGNKLENLCEIINKIGYFEKEHGSEYVSKKLYDSKKELKDRETKLLKINYSGKQIETEENPEIMITTLDWLGAL